MQNRMAASVSSKIHDKETIGTTLTVALRLGITIDPKGDLALWCQLFRTERVDLAIIFGNGLPCL